MSLFGSDKKERATVSESGFFSGVHSGMWLASKGMVLAFVFFTALNVELANDIYSAVRSWIETTLAWYYIGAVTFMLFTCLCLMFSRFGNLRLGEDDSRPEFSNFSWFAMLFSAGVGIGLLFFSIAEPMFYFDNSMPRKYPNNPLADHAGVTELTQQRATHAMRVTYFHWGFHG
jgi:choline/glycine/proline betaine transport protein